MHSVQKEIGRLNSKSHLLTKYFEIIVLDLLSGVFQKASTQNFRDWDVTPLRNFSKKVGLLQKSL